MQRTVFLTTVFFVAATSAALAAEERRELSAHEHGVGALNIAFEGTAVAMELEAPGADIVGFEHPAESADDKAAIDNAIAVLSNPLELFVFPEGAGCAVTEAAASLVKEDDDHDDEEEHTEEHGEDDHEEDQAHGEEAHEDEHAHAEKHDDHGEEASHTEFHAEYLLECSDPSAIKSIQFSYFDVFENAEELEIQLIAGKGTAGYEVGRDAPLLDLSEMM